MTERLPADTEPLATLVAEARRAGVDLSHAWVVGGAVRDALLGHPVVDLDIAVEGDAAALAAELAVALGGRVLATHGFGTAVLVAPLGDEPDARIDLASTRSETYAKPGALPSVELGAVIADDLKRRDFTINSIAAPLNPDEPGALLDPLNGVGDLRDRTVRVLHDDSFNDDPTRIFRAARYAARYGFALDSHTHELLRAAVAGGAINTISVDRVRAELELVCEEPAAAALRLLNNWGVLPLLAPQLTPHLDAAIDLVARIDDEQHGDATLNAMAWRMRFAALVRALGASEAREQLMALRLRASDVAAISEKVRLFDELGQLSTPLAETTLVERRGLLGAYGHETLLLAELATDDDAERAAIREYHDTVGEIRLTITGHDLLAMGIERGPAVGEVLEELYDLWLAGHVASAEQERTAAQRLIDERARSEEHE